jgi:hypothetical protein
MAGSGNTWFAHNATQDVNHFIVEQVENLRVGFARILYSDQHN